MWSIHAKKALKICFDDSIDYNTSNLQKDRCVLPYSARMKIAFVGKGGSGKSTMSWLASEVSVADGHHTLTIDADHNMDICHIYDVEVDDSFPTLHRAHDTFRHAVHHQQDSRWHEIVLDGRTLPTFTLSPADAFTASVTHQLKPHHYLTVTGLGTSDILHSGRCAHGHSAPLKYYLPLLTLQPNERVIVDGVAGVDMLNFGLFTGVDVMIGVVEPHPNSIRVLEEIIRLGKTTGIPTGVLINKARDNDHYRFITTTYASSIIGEIGLDEQLLDYDSTSITPHTRAAMAAALDTATSLHTETSGLDRLRAFETAKQMKHT